MSATDSGSDNELQAPRKLARRIFLAGIVWPIATIAIGVDGGDIFQILAIDNLDLDPRALGIALGLGTLSIPVQIWAARIPLERARMNIRIHLWFTGTMALVVAALIAFAEPGSTIASLALVIAVMAEISVSVLIATSWQPVISYTLSAKQRQFLNGQGRAAKGVTLLLCVVFFGQLDQTGRAWFMVILGLLVIGAGCWLHVLPPPPGSSKTDAVHDERQNDTSADGAKLGTALRNIFLVEAAMGLAWWPLMLTYVALVLWPTVNLGFLGAALALGGIVASALWRDPGDYLIPAIKSSAVLLATCSVAIAFIQPGVSTTVGVALLVFITIGTAARTVLSIGVEELTHRRIDEHNSVRTMTMSDAIGSTSFQLGFFVAGFLVAASKGSTSSFNPYQVWLVAAAGVLVVMTARLRDRGYRVVQ